MNKRLLSWIRYKSNMGFAKTNIPKLTRKNIDYLGHLPEDYPLIVVSFFATNPGSLAKLEVQWEKRDPAHQRFLGRSEEETTLVTSKDLGGSINLIDPQRLDFGFLAEIESPVATGMYYHPQKECLFVGSNKWIQKIVGGKIIATLGNTLFNDLHTLSRNLEGNLLATSTGVDGLLEVSFDNTERLIWSWLATEHGYDLKPNGEKRVIDRQANYQEVGTSTPEHTTHVNSSLNYRTDKILATLFHQGTLIEIDKQNGSSRILLEGLKSPHHARQRKEGFLVSDTRNNRVLLLDHSFAIKKAFENDYNWIQDCLELENGHYLIGDSNNSRIVRVDENGHQTEVLEIERGTRKISSFLSLTKREAWKEFYE